MVSTGEYTGNGGLSALAYDKLVENCNDIVQVVDLNGYFLYVNRAWEEVLGYDRGQISEMNFFSVLHPDCQCHCQQRLQRLLQGERLPRFEVRFRSAEGETVIAEGSISLYTDAQGNHIGVQGIFRDIRQRKQAEQALRESEERFRTIFESSVAGIAMLKPDGSFIRANPAFCAYLGYSEEELKQLKITDVTHPQDVQETLAKRSLAFAQRNHAIVREKRYVRKDGSTFWAQLSSTWYFDDQGNPLYTVPVIQDITPRKEAEQKIHELAYYDSLTGLPNRPLLLDRLRQALHDARRREHPLAVMFMDLDRFKDANDTYGHSLGDALLAEVAHKLRHSLRENDTVARLGGDEFVVLLTTFRSLENLPHVAAKILNAVGGSYRLQGRELHVSASLGVAVFPQDGHSCEELLRQADMAMYAAKNAGGNGCRFYSSNMNAQAQERMALESRLRRALERQELFLRYQPQYDARRNAIVGVEALIRWQHPYLGEVSPARFIPVAEESQLIVSIGEWVLRQACQQAQKWQALLDSPLRVAVNLSQRQLAHPGLLDTVRDALESSGLPPHLLELELTESMLFETGADVQDILEQLRAMGITLAIDDFGTGCSSLMHLKKLPIQRLKVDRSFVAGLPDHKDDEAIVGATVAMAHKLGLAVTAEGIENAAQKGFLQQLGCYEMQGFLWHRPLAPEPLLSCIRKGQKGAVSSG